MEVSIDLEWKSIRKWIGYTQNDGSPGNFMYQGALAELDPWCSVLGEDGEVTQQY